jgi:hypothetical protein
MADLDPLIRVRKHALEQKRKFLAELYRQAEELANQKTTLLNQLEEEREKLREMEADMLSYFGPYSEAVKTRVADIDEARSKLEIRIQAAQEDMRMSFAALKKIEITQERREQAEENALNRKEAAELDEIGLDVFRRQRDEEA